MKKQETLMIKGVALILMLIHHLFYNMEAIGRCTLLWNGGGEYLVYFAQMCKVCVALFALLSGYGLQKSHSNMSYEKDHVRNGIRFSMKHIWALLVQYWWAVVPFAIYGVMTGVRPLAVVYGTEPGAWMRMLTDFLGINFFLYGTANMYNVTCWYISIALGFYILFPVLQRLLRKSVLCFCGTVLVISFCKSVLIWVFLFALGMLLAEYGVLDRAADKIALKGRETIIGSVLLLLGTALMRVRQPINADGFFAVGIIYAVLTITSYIPALKKGLVVIGKHSANVTIQDPWSQALPTGPRLTGESQ